MGVILHEKCSDIALRKALKQPGGQQCGCRTVIAVFPSRYNVAAWWRARCPPTCPTAAMELNDDLDVDGLVAGLVVSSVLCLCCTVCCVRAQRGDRDPRATAPQRRRLLTQDVIDKFRAYSAKLAESLVERSYYRINRRGMALYVQEHFPANVARGLEDRDGLLVLPGGESEARDNLKGVVCFVHGVHDSESGLRARL